MKLIFLDDDESFLADIRDFCEELDELEVECLTDPLELRNRIVEKGRLFCDIVFVDYDLGNHSLTGIRVISEIREVQADIPVAIMTNSDDPRVGFSASEAGATTVCNKDYLVSAEALGDVVLTVVTAGFQQQKHHLDKADERIQGVHRLIDEFVHDTRNVFVPIQSSASEISQIVDSGIKDEIRGELSYALRSIGVSADRIFAKAEEGMRELVYLEELSVGGDISLKTQRIELFDFVKECCDKYLSDTRPRDLQFGVKEALFDRDIVEKILRCLFRNIEDHVPGNTPVSVRAFEKEFDQSRVVFLEVRDFGPGIPREFRKSIFEPGVFVPEAHRSNSNLGLGLAIARKFAGIHSTNRMRGTIYCEAPEDGVGCQFTLQIPEVENG